MEAESAGRIEVEPYPLYELGDDADLLALTAEGVIQMAVPQTSSLASLSVEALDEYPLDIPKVGRFGIVWMDFTNMIMLSQRQLLLRVVLVRKWWPLADLADQPFSCLGYAYEGP